MTAARLVLATALVAALGGLAAAVGSGAPRGCGAAPASQSLTVPIGGRTMPVISFHGTADPVDPYAGHGQPYWRYSVPAAEVDWARHDGCASSPAVSHPAPTVTLTTYSRCRDGARVELYSIEGEGHEWPDGPQLPRPYLAVLGPQSSAVDADRLIWAFFMSRSARRAR